MDHKQRFMGWRKRMPENTRYLVDRVLERVVPEFERHGFVWRPDFQVAANVIPLQKEVGIDWPTVEIRFVPKGPFFRIEFSALPELCEDIEHRIIRREEANLASAPAWFFLCECCNENGQCKSEFGFQGWLPSVTLSPVKTIRYLADWRQVLDSEVGAALILLPVLLNIFDKDMCRDWRDHPFGYVNEHVFMSMSHKIRGDLERARQSQPNLTPNE